MAVRTSLWVLAAAWATVSAAGCSAASSPPSSTSDDGGGSAEGGVDAAAEGAEGAEGPPACVATSACRQQPTASQECVTTVSATLIDPGGAPAAGVPVFVCGTNLCSAPVKTAADGTVALDLCLPLATPALKLFDDPAWGPFAAALQGAGPSFALGLVTITALPTAGATLASGTSTVTSGGVTLSLASTTVKFDIEHTTPDSQMFRAAAVDVASLPPPLAGAVTAAWALAPLNTRLTPPAQLVLPNPGGLAAGAAVDVYLNGTDTTTATPFAPWGKWGLLGTGAVSTDGQTIVLTSAQGGLPEIAMVGVKLH